MSYWKLEIECENGKNNTVNIYDDYHFTVEPGIPDREITTPEIGELEMMIKHMNSMKITHMECTKIL